MLKSLVLTLGGLFSLPLVLIYLVAQLALGFSDDSVVGGASRKALTLIFPQPIEGDAGGRGRTILGRYVMPLDSRHLSRPAPDYPQVFEELGVDLRQPLEGEEPGGPAGADLGALQVCFSGDVDALRNNISYLLGEDLEIVGDCLTADEVERLLASLSNY